MTYRGHVKNGQVALDEPIQLPEGAQVNVEVVENGQAAPSEGLPTIWEKLLELAGTVEGLPSDMAENHDHYLYGTPKK
ncbi:MAG TPA: hypothetical protein VGM76_06085 [Lacipirellulaceae bacterium]|jgi:hypothetical protein